MNCVLYHKTRKNQCKSESMISLAYVNRYGRSGRTVFTLYQLVIILGFGRCVAKRRVVTAVMSFSAISLSR